MMGDMIRSWGACSGECGYLSGLGLGLILSEIAGYAIPKQLLPPSLGPGAQPRFPADTIGVIYSATLSHASYFHPCSPSLLPIPAPHPCSRFLLPIPAPHSCRYLGVEFRVEAALYLVKAGLSPDVRGGRGEAWEYIE